MIDFKYHIWIYSTIVNQLLLPNISGVVRLKQIMIISLCFLVIHSFLPVFVTDSTVQAQPVNNLTISNAYELRHGDHYHGVRDLNEELALLESFAPELLQLDIIGQSYQNRDIKCMRITNERILTQKAQFLVVAGHHSREPIGVEASLRFIRDLVNGYGLNSEITNLLNTEEIYVIPTINPDGLYYRVDKGNEWLRKNLRPFDDDGDDLYDEDSPEDMNGDGYIAEQKIYDYTTFQTTYQLEGFDNDGDGLINEDSVGGVDLNRNYGYQWNNPESDSWSTDPRSEVYTGAFPFSEPETATLQNFTLKHHFPAAISLHSGSNCTLFPFSYNGTSAQPNLYSSILDDINNILPAYFANAPDIGYTSPGDWGDWMYTNANCLVPITFEIYHNSTFDPAFDAYKVVVDNATVKIWEARYMYKYFSPNQRYLEQSWNDIDMTFNYFLTLAPRLDITITSQKTTKSTEKMNNMITNIDIRNLSPQLSTIGDIEVIVNASSGCTVFPSTIQTIAASSIDHAVIQLDYSPTIAENTQVFRIGNNFTGYTVFVYRNGHIEVLQGSNAPTYNTSTHVTLPPKEELKTSAFTWLAIVSIPSLALLKKKKTYFRFRG